MKDFSKKNPNEIINELKVTMINRILKQIKELLSNEPSAQFLDLLDNDTLPSYSDTVLILTQYKSAIAHFRSIYYIWDGMDHRWRTKEQPELY